MTRLANFLQSVNLNIDPRILLYIFLGLACLSLISLCSILTTGGKKHETTKKPAKKIKPKKEEELKIQLPVEPVKIEEKPIELIKPEVNLIEETKPEETVTIIEEQPELPTIEPLAPVEEEIELPAIEPLTEEVEIPELSETVQTVSVDTSEIPELPISFDSGRVGPVYLTPKEPEIEPEPIAKPSIESLIPQIEEKQPEVTIEPKEVVAPPRPAPMPIFSSVYLERKEEPAPVEEIEHSEIIEAPPAPEPTPAPVIEPIKPEIEEEVVPAKTPEIYPDIIDEIQAQRHDDKANLNFSLSRAMPGKVLPDVAEESSKIEEPAVKEVILTPEVLKARLAKLNETVETPSIKTPPPAPKSNDELDQILKQIGLDNMNSAPEIANEEKIILGR